jgi:hypothetical protein
MSDKLQFVVVVISIPVCLSGETFDKLKFVGQERRQSEAATALWIAIIRLNS